MRTMTSGKKSFSSTQFFLGVGVGVLLGFCLSWSFGMFVNGYHPVEESKLCREELISERDKLQPQTREYLKARYYWNAAVWISPSWQTLIDFGPVDDSLLGGLHPYKDASSSFEVYRDALHKYHLPTNTR